MANDGCVHVWELGPPRAEEREEGYFHIVSGVCSECEAERDFETNMDELDRSARNMFRTKGMKPSARLPLNVITKIWD